jgi:hypothetical protein
MFAAELVKQIGQKLNPPSVKYKEEVDSAVLEDIYQKILKTDKFCYHKCILTASYEISQHQEHCLSTNFFSSPELCIAKAINSIEFLNQLNKDPEVGREYRDFVFEKIKTPPPPRFDALS